MRPGLLAWLVASYLAGCIGSGKVVCGDGRICPANYQCDDIAHRCFSPDQVTACAGLGSNDPCVVSTAPGVCTNGACEPFICGDGLVSGNEQCDGDNLDGKTCKDVRFYNDAGLTCTSACTFDTSACTGFCGDGVVNGDEQCDGAPPFGACVDFGYDAGPLTCGDSCGASFSTCGRLSWHLEGTGVAGMGLAGTSHTDQWVVGQAGGIAHYNGITWVLGPALVAADLDGVFADAVDDVWAVGTGVVLHYDGTSWQVVADAPASDYTAVWAASSTSVFAASSDHQVQSWNGSTWQNVGVLDATAVVSITGTSATDLWITKFDGSLWHWDGGSWTQPAVTGKFGGVSALAPDDVWVSGSTTDFASGVVSHWDGHTWTTTTTPNQQYATIAAEGPHDVWVGIQGEGIAHFDGISWTPMSLSLGSATPAALTRFGSVEVLAVSYLGPAYRFTGQAYAQHSGVAGGGNAAIWSASGEDIFVGNGSAVLRLTGSAWLSSLAGANGSIVALSGSSSSDIWAITTSSKAYRYTGTWATVTTGVPALGTMQKIWDVGPGDVWFFTSAGIGHLGSATAYLTEVSTWNSVSGTSTNNIWAVGGSGSGVSALYHWDGTWSAVLDVLIVHASRGQRGRPRRGVRDRAPTAAIARWDGSTWTVTKLTPIDPLTSIVAVAPDDVVVASDIELYHFDGTRWSPMRPAHDINAGRLHRWRCSRHVARDTSRFSPTTLHVDDLIRTVPWVWPRDRDQLQRRDRRRLRRADRSAGSGLPVAQNAPWIETAAPPVTGVMSSAWSPYTVRPRLR